MGIINEHFEIPGKDFPPQEFMNLGTQQGQINWLAQFLMSVNNVFDNVSGTVTTLEPDASAYVEIEFDDTNNSATFDFYVPQGQTGAPGHLESLTATAQTLAAGQSATATVVFDEATQSAAFTFGIPTTNPTDEQITTAVDAWLDDHPEATTTVQDNSITNAKLVQSGGVLEELDFINSYLNILSGFEGFGASVSENENNITFTKSGTTNWYCGGIKNTPLKFNASNIEYLPIAYGTSSQTQNYVFILAVYINNTSNFGKAIVFSYHLGNQALGTDHALTSLQVLNTSATYSANPDIEYSYSGTNITISYNGLSSTLDISTVNVSTSLTGTFSTPFIGVICHTSVQGNSYTITYKSTWFNTVNIVNRWKNKTWCAFGDSITGYDYFEPLVKSQLELSSYTNMGSGGSSIAELYAGQTAAFCNRYDTIASGYDVITILGGTNDFGKNIPLGTKGSTDKTTFYGGITSLLSGIKTKFPTTPILFFTPLQRDYFGTGDEISGMTNGNGNTLKQYRDIIIEMCSEAGIPCFDLYSMSGLYPENVHSWTIDGLHPNQTYWNTHYQLIADFINKYKPTN